MRKRMHDKKPPEYLEGIIFSENEAIVIEGEMQDTPAELIFFDTPSSLWYYQFAKNKHQTFSVSLIDYLFRYDRGAFWMGSYVLNPSILTRLFPEGIWGLKDPTPFTYSDRMRYSSLKGPNALVRALSYPFTSSQTLYSLLHSCEDWVNERFIIQDFTLPLSTVGGFYESVKAIAPIYPLWLCPVKAPHASQLFAPHSLEGEDSINIGVYGIPRCTTPLKECVASLETRLCELKGKKWFYTHSYFSEDAFWNIYHREEYLQLRRKYHAENAWMSIEDKLLNTIS